MVQDGCGFVLTKGMILLTSGPGMTRKLKNEQSTWKCILLVPYRDKGMCSIQHSVAKHGWKEVVPVVWHAVHLQMWNHPNVARLTAHQYLCHTVFTSAWPLHCLIRKLYSLPNKQKPTITQSHMCMNRSPHPNFSGSRQCWPLSGSLSQYALR